MFSSKILNLSSWMLMRLYSAKMLFTGLLESTRWRSAQLSRAVKFADQLTD